MKKLFTCGLSLMAVFAVAACRKDDNPKEQITTKPSIPDAEGWYDTEALSSEVTLNIAVADDQKFYITNQNAASFVGLDGETYASGALLPSWRYMEKRLNMKFVDTAKGKRGENYTEHSGEGFTRADIINNSVSTINEEGSKGTFLNLLGADESGVKYVNIEDPANSYMPNFSEFLKRNPTLAKAMQVDGKLYTTQYFDGFGEPEHFFHFNVDMVKNILDAELTNANEGAKGAITYNEFNKYTADAKVEITVGLNNDADTKVITKKNTGKNAMTEVKKAATGKAMIENLRAHLNSVYDGLVGEGKTYKKLSDIFVSESASYDTDELVALMYCIKNNEAQAQGVAKGSETAIDLYTVRESKSGASNQRAVNLLQGLGIMYGVRGAMESKCNAAIYLDKDGKIQDGRCSDEFIKMFDFSSKLYADGIIANNYNSEAKPITKIKTKQLFMMYDYMNNTTNDSNTGTGDAKINFEAVLPPVYNWDDGDSNTDYIHFAESNRSSSKTETWGVPARVATDKSKLKAVLTLMDYLYSIEGDMLMNYGPNAEQVTLYGGANKNAYCTDTKVKSYSKLRGGNIEHYTMSEGALKAMNTKNAEGATAQNPQNGAGWNKWSKQEMGSNLPIGFVREFFAEYETMSTNGKAGYDRVSTAFAITGTYKTLVIGASNPFYECVPGLTLTGTAAEIANTKKGVTGIFNGDKNSDGNVNYVKFGFGNAGNLSVADYKALITSNMLGDEGLIKLYSDAYAKIK